MPTDNSNTLRVVSSTLATLFQTVVIAKGQYQPQVVRMPPAKEGVESGCNNIIRVLHSSSKRKDYSEVKEKSF